MQVICLFLSKYQILSAMKIIFKISILLIFSIGYIACQNESDKSEPTIEKKTQNLEAFARLYGYARWFHPSDEAQDIDWDRFAILGVRKVEKIKSTADLRDTLYRLFSPIVQGLQIYDTQKPEASDIKNLLSPDPNAKSIAWQHTGVGLNNQPGLYKSIRTITSDTNLYIPQLGEVTKEPIGNNLTCVVPLALQTNNAATYPKTEATSLNQLKSELSNINIREDFNQETNLASIIITWNVLQHFFPYFDAIETDWSGVLGETLKSTLLNKQKSDFYITLSQMIAQIQDGHGIIFDTQKYRTPLIRTEYIENKIVVTASLDTTLRRGDIIHEINGEPSMNVLYEKEKIISGSPQLRRHRALNILTGMLESDKAMTKPLFHPENKNIGNNLLSNGISLVVERNAKKRNVLITDLRDRDLLFNPIDERKYTSKTIIEIEPDIFYINLVKCTEREFEQRKKQLANAKAVIYDQRGGRGLDLKLIISHLTEKPVTSTWWNIPQTVYPDRKAVVFNKSNWSIQPKQPLFKSKSIIINTPSVISTGETMMGIISHYDLATTIGEPTAGCNGNVNRIYLPCGYKVMWTGMKVLKHDCSQLYLNGFKPDYPASKTIEAVKEGRDEYLEKALEIARQE